MFHLLCYILPSLASGAGDDGTRSVQFIHDPLQVFYLKGVKKAPVLDEHGRPVGTLSYLDLARARMQYNKEASSTNLKAF